MNPEPWTCRFALTLIGLFLVMAVAIEAQTTGDPRYYDTGSPTLTDIWVDPVNGNDSNNGSTRGQALRTLAAAWNRIPSGTTLSGSGRRVMLTAGNYPESSIPNYLERRYGTAAFPIIFQSADGRGSAVLQGDLNIFDCRYLYLIDLTIRPVPAGDTLHFEQCSFILMRGLELDGGLWTGEGQTTPVAHETLKINQCQYIYLEFGQFFQRRNSHKQIQILGVSSFDVMQNGNSPDENIIDLSIFEDGEKVLDGLD